MSYKLARLTVVFALALTAVCTYISAEVRNNTGQPVFANTAYYRQHQLVEEEGVLLNANGKFEFPIYGNGTFIRVRDLSGNTITFLRAKDDDDTTIEAISLKPVAEAEPLGRLAKGDNGPTRSFVCGDDKDGMELFGTTVSITSEHAEPLVISLVADWAIPGLGRRSPAYWFPLALPQMSTANLSSAGGSRQLTRAAIWCTRKLSQNLRPHERSDPLRRRTNSSPLSGSSADSIH